MSNILSFDVCSFHDCYIHGVSFNLVEEVYFGQEVLIVDIDYVVGWPSCADKTTQDNYFNVSKATLNFKEIDNVKINFSGNAQFIDRVEKIFNTEITPSGTPSQHPKWMIYNFRQELIIELNASDLVVELIGRVHTIKNRQFLTSEERNEINLL